MNIKMREIRIRKYRVKLDQVSYNYKSDGIHTTGKLPEG